MYITLRVYSKEILKKFRTLQNVINLQLGNLQNNFKTFLNIMWPIIVSDDAKLIHISTFNWNLFKYIYEYN